MTELIATLRPVLEAVADLDLHHPDLAVDHLRQRLPRATMDAVTEALLAAHADRALTPRQATPTLWFGRVAKASEATCGLSVDVVDMRGAGAAHTHPQGEVSWCIPMEDAPRFEGAADGWVVMPPGSQHTPTVTGGRMLIVYFLPEGALTWS